MRTILCLTLTLFCLTCQAQECVHVDETVLIQDKGSYGSGIVFKNGSNTFVWTDAHVIKNAQSSGTTGFQYRDVWVSKLVISDGRKVGEDRRLARVIRFSEAQDIALLRVHQKDWHEKSVKFSSEKTIPKPGNPVWHVGSFNGQAGENSVSDGVIAAVGRLRKNYVHEELDNPVVYDQVSLIAHHGSSGGGIFDKNSGECLGLLTEYLTLTTPGSFCLTPTRRLHEYAEKTDCLWAFSNKFNVPDVITVGTDETPIVIQSIPKRVDTIPTEAVPDFLLEIIQGIKKVTKK